PTSTPHSPIQVNGYPTVVLLDEQGEVISLDANDIILSLPFANWKRAEQERKAREARMASEVEAFKNNFNLFSFLSKTVQSPLYNAQGEVPVSQLQGKVVGVYFSAHWCPPCRGFTPLLADKYRALQAAHKGFEVVFVSSDRSSVEFNEYFKDMPWVALDYSERDAKEILSRVFGVGGIPTLLLFDTDGTLMTKEGREVVMTLAYDDWAEFETKKRARQEDEARKVSTMPDEAQVEAHEHVLKKLPHVYRGVYGCDVCETEGQGWVYHCEHCGWDAHPLCIFKDT
ncbi:redoxin domain-containing protein, partial [archaeon]